MFVENLQKDARALVAPDATMNCVANGFVFIRGTLQHPRDRGLLFSDFIGNRVPRYSDPEGPAVFRGDSSHVANGNARDYQGFMLTRVISAELEKRCSPPVIIETQLRAANTIGIEQIAKHPDGQQRSARELLARPCHAAEEKTRQAVVRIGRRRRRCPASQRED